MAVTVPTVSKKSESRRVKTNRTAETNEIWLNDPKRLNWPKSEKSGVEAIESGSAGMLSPQPFGLLSVGEMKLGPILNALSRMIARMVAPTIPMRIAPLVFRTIKVTMRMRPKMKTTIGHPTRFPPSPSCTGTGPVPVRRTKPESTRPIKAMKRPIPTEIAYLSCCGTALKTAVLKPVRTRTVMIKPSRTTRPIASAHVIFDAMP